MLSLCRVRGGCCAYSVQGDSASDSIKLTFRQAPNSNHLNICIIIIKGNDIKETHSCRGMFPGKADLIRSARLTET